MSRIPIEQERKVLYMLREVPTGDLIAELVRRGLTPKEKKGE